MKNYKQILEAVNKGIKFALDDFEDNEQIQGQSNSKVNHQHGTKEWLDLMNETIDLNLPSGILWCKYNLGCDVNLLNNNPKSTLYEDWLGDHYAWGEIIPNNNTNINRDELWENYKYCSGSSTLLTKYCPRGKKYWWAWDWSDSNVKRIPPDGKLILEDIDDPCKNKSSYLNFRMPAKQDVQELIENTNHRYISNNYNGIKYLCGMLFVSKVNPENQLFMPCEYNKYKTFANGDYWINSIDKSTPYEANLLYFDDTVEPRITSGYRANLNFIRPVLNL